MNETEIRIAIAELDGWSDFRRDLIEPNILFGTKCFGEIGCEEFEIPNYTSDLGAVREVVIDLDSTQLAGYRQSLNTICGGYTNAIDATARQRCEAILCAVGKWKDTQ